MNALTIGRRLRAARIAAGFEDPDSFAELLNYSPSRYRKIEDGTLAELEIIAVFDTIGQVTNKSLDFLLRGSNGKS